MGAHFEGWVNCQELTHYFSPIHQQDDETLFYLHGEYIASRHDMTLASPECPRVETGTSSTFYRWEYKLRKFKPLSNGHITI